MVLSQPTVAIAWGRLLSVTIITLGCGARVGDWRPEDICWLLGICAGGDIMLMRDSTRLIRDGDCSGEGLSSSRHRSRVGFCWPDTSSATQHNCVWYAPGLLSKPELIPLLVYEGADDPCSVDCSCHRARCLCCGISGGLVSSPSESGTSLTLEKSVWLRDGGSGLEKLSQGDWVC